MASDEIRSRSGMSTFPTRFLVVGQALKIAIDRADGVEGIKVKGRTYSFVPKLRDRRALRPNG